MNQAVVGGGEPELAAIREDLGAIRGHLIRGGLSDAQELAERLRSAVEKFRKWTTTGPVDRQSVAEIQRELGELQPLFENAYALQAGWFSLLDLEQSQGGGQYDASAQRSPLAVSVQAERTIEERG